MKGGRLECGETISGLSALLLFAFMFLDWFGVKLVNTSNLLFYVQSVEPGKNAWEALDYFPFFLLLTIGVSLAGAALRLTRTGPEGLRLADALIATLGVGSVLWILYRILNPPVFLVEPTIKSEGAVQLPIFFALAAAVGIAFGGLLALWERRLTLPGRRPNAQSDRAEILGDAVARD
jgi:hypothetical protein